MTRINVPVLTLLGNAASGVDLTSGAISASASNHKLYNPAGRTCLVCYTDSMGAVTLTFTSVADPYGRTGDLGPTVVGASAFMIFGPFSNQLFSQQSGADQDYLYITAASITAAAKLNGLNIF